MEPFLKLKWPYRDLSLKEKGMVKFLPENMLNDFYFDKDINFELSKTNEENEQICEKYVPGLKYQFIHTIKSNLNYCQQVKCLKALLIYQTGKQKLTEDDKDALKTFNELKPLIYEENKTCQDYAQKFWLKRQFMLYFSNDNRFRLFGELCWMKRFSEVLRIPNLYTENIKIPISYSENEEKLEMIHIKNLIEAGSVGKFQIPTLKNKVCLKIYTFPNIKLNQCFNFQLPLSEDDNIKSLLEHNAVDVIISSSGLKTLLQADLNEQWQIPIKIKTITTTVDGKSTKRNVVFIEKSLPKHPSRFNFYHKCCKMMVKTNFCQFKAFEYENKYSTSDIPEDRIAEVNNYRMKIFPKHNKKNKLQESKNFNQVHSNATYRLWELKQQSNGQNNLIKTNSNIKPIRILIRNKIDGCEQKDKGILQPVTVNCKLEYQLEYGARLPTKKELSDQWVNLYFKPYSQLYRVLLHSKSTEIVKVEPCDIKKVSNELITHYNYNPNINFGRLQKVFSLLIKLNPGNYLLNHTVQDGSFASLMETATDEKTATLDLLNMYSQMKLKQLSFNDQQWIPIDTSMVLPAHIELNQMPGLFKGYRYNLYKRKKENDACTATKKQKRDGKTKQKKEQKRPNKKPACSTSIVE